MTITVTWNSEIFSVDKDYEDVARFEVDDRGGLALKDDDGNTVGFHAAGNWSWVYDKDHVAKKTIRPHLA